MSRVWLIVYKRKNSQGMAFVKAKDHTDAENVLKDTIKDKIQILGIRGQETIKPNEHRQILYAYEEVSNE